MDPAQSWEHGFGFMWLIPILIFVMFVFFLRGIFGPGSPGCGLQRDKESAQEILDKRFAKGEISKDEYESMKKTLENRAF